MRRGITPIIAVILLLMMTVAAAGAAFYWISRIQAQMQGGVESYQETMFGRMASRVDVIDADYDGDTTQILHIWIQNTGNTKIPIDDSSVQPTTNWWLEDANQNVVCSTNWAGSGGAPDCKSGCGTDLDVGEIREIQLDFTGSDCSITSYANGSLFSFTIDFSGKVTTTGSFVK